MRRESTRGAQYNFGEEGTKYKRWPQARARVTRQLATSERRVKQGCLVVSDVVAVGHSTRAATTVQTNEIRKKTTSKKKGKKKPSDGRNERPGEIESEEKVPIEGKSSSIRSLESFTCRMTATLPLSLLLLNTREVPALAVRLEP